MDLFVDYRFHQNEEHQESKLNHHLRLYLLLRFCRRLGSDLLFTFSAMSIFGRTMGSFVSWTFATSFADIIAYNVLAYRLLVGFPLRIQWCPWRLLGFLSTFAGWLASFCSLTIDCWLLTDPLCRTPLMAFSKLKCLWNEMFYYLIRKSFRNDEEWRLFYCDSTLCCRVI